jgi:ubiquinone/menaquinone biosynthesis C-methylase UbiE
MATERSGGRVEIPAVGLRLNIGCGARVLDGWTNCDIQANQNAPRPPEILCDAKSIPLPDGCATELMAIHVFEHFYRWEVETVLAEWRRLLRPGGVLVLELPNLIKCCENYLAGRMRGGKDPDQLARWGIYGDPRTGDKFMCHPWGYSPEELQSILEANGFRGVIHKPTTFHPAGRKHRDMRIEARK